MFSKPQLHRLTKLPFEYRSSININEYENKAFVFSNFHLKHFAQYDRVFKFRNSRIYDVHIKIY